MSIVNLKGRYYILFLWMNLLACGPDNQHATQAQTILNGQEVSENNYRSVIAIIMNDSSMCTGTLVSPHVVLTAAHCVQGFESFSILFGNIVDQPLASLQTNDSWVHPDYDAQQLYNDIALLRLVDNPPAGILPLPYLTAHNAVIQDDIGQPIDMVGFGQTEVGSSGTKMIGTNELWLVCTSASGCIENGYYAPNKTFCQDQSPSGICFGDSGGPGFIMRQGKQYVAGVASFVGTETCGGIGCHTKVGAFEAEIKDFINGELGAFCDANTECQSGICSDGVCCSSTCAPCETCDSPDSWGTCSRAPDGTLCSDSNACNGEETCLAGSCQSGTDLICDDDKLCTEDLCDPTAGCQNPTKEIGTPCGQCHTCSASGSCDTTADNTSCSDENICNGEEICQAGLCSTGESLVCDDQNPCTQDLCDPTTGCLFEEDLSLCTVSGGCMTTGEQNPSASHLWWIALAMAGLFLLKSRSG